MSNTRALLWPATSIVFPALSGGMVDAMDKSVEGTTRVWVRVLPSGITLTQGSIALLGSFLCASLPV